MDHQQIQTEQTMHTVSTTDMPLEEFMALARNHMLRNQPPTRGFPPENQNPDTVHHPRMWIGKTVQTCRLPKPHYCYSRLAVMSDVDDGGVCPECQQRKEKSAVL
jgi:hypothetical protein